MARIKPLMWVRGNGRHAKCAGEKDDSQSVCSLLRQIVIGEKQCQRPTRNDADLTDCIDEQAAIFHRGNSSSISKTSESLVATRRRHSITISDAVSVPFRNHRFPSQQPGNRIRMLHCFQSRQASLYEAREHPGDPFIAVRRQMDIVDKNVAVSEINAGKVEKFPARPLAAFRFR